jgi:exopolysaccharide production protein ExoQ
LGRDMTLTGRTEIWQRVLNEDINPLLGEGFYSFWLGNRTDKLSESFAYPLNEAHNGYLETYLNSGLIGLFLLLALLASSAKRIQKKLRERSDHAALALAFLISIVIYNVTESAFDRLDIVWFALLLFIMEYPPLTATQSESDEELFDHIHIRAADREFVSSPIARWSDSQKWT